MNDYSAKTLLGQATAYASQYDPQLLCPFPRQVKRDEIGVTAGLPFSGVDLWNGYELSWLNAEGLPQVAMAVFAFPCTSPYLIESKSFKLYLNSFNQTRISSWPEVAKRMQADLSAVSGGEVEVKLIALDEVPIQLVGLPGTNIDRQRLAITSYQLDPQILRADPSREVSEQLHSHLLKSNCLVTRQPDWGSVLIDYRGPRIDRAALLRYLVSFREHNEFHEQCVERIFTDLLRFCQSAALSVQAWYTRRGGLDINPFRTNCENEPLRVRLVRQ